MNGEISSSLQRLHQLAWQAGEWMHQGWWQVLSLTNWQNSYRRHSACRPLLNQLISQRRGFPLHPLPSELTSQQQQLLALEPRLLHLCTALGLLAMACPDYLLLRKYRCRLSVHLGEHGCDQLLTLGTFISPEPATLDPESLSEAAQELGVRWLQNGADACPVVAAMQIVLPPIDGTVLPRLESPVPWLLRIGRFL
jgi:Type III secretion system subunit